MNNQMTINGHVAVISFDPDADIYRGEFVGLNGGADFYADTVDDLHKEGEASLKAFLEICQAQRIEPLPPIITSLKGCLSSVQVPDLNKDDYHTYLEKKFQ